LDRFIDPSLLRPTIAVADTDSTAGPSTAAGAKERSPSATDTSQSSPAQIATEESKEQGQEKGKSQDNDPLEKGGYKKGQVQKEESAQNARSIQERRVTTYAVQSGDTPQKIARRFGITLDQLQDWNDLEDMRLEKGQKIRVRPPSGDSSSSGSVTAKRSSPNAEEDTSPTTNSYGDSDGASSDETSQSGIERDEDQVISPARATTDTASDISSSRGPSDPTGSQSASSSSVEPLPGSVPSRYKRTSPAYAKVKNAAATYRRSGYARVVLTDEKEEVYPYGKEVPTIYTPVLHFTTVMLAKNEYVTNISIGDKQRWTVTTGSMGNKRQFQQMVYIKPEKCGPARTNLMLNTNKQRSYQMILESIPCNLAQGERPDLDQWTRKVSFYYPDGRSVGPSNMMKDFDRPSMQGPPQNMRRRSATPRRRGGRAPSRSMNAPRSQSSDSARAPKMGPSAGSTAPSRRPASRAAPPMRNSSPAAAPSRRNPGQAGRTSRFRSDRGGSSKVDLRNINTSNYEIDADRGFPCEIKTVGDDGERTYLRLADTPGCQSTFPLYQLQERGQLQMTNYNVFNGQTYVVEGVHDDLALVYREDNGQERRTTIENTSISNPRR
jgi:LysM repeat protein/type IV secretory pathway VirB9-like protein